MWLTWDWMFWQVKVPFRLGGAEGTGWAPAVLQDRAHGICPASLLQCIPLQAVLCHSWILFPGEAKIAFKCPENVKADSSYVGCVKNDESNSFDLNW